MYYWNQAKENRARNIVEKPLEDWLEMANHSEASAEYKLYRQGAEQELEGEELVQFIYRGLGGKLLSDEEAGEKAEEMNESVRIQPDASKANRAEDCPGCGVEYKNLKLHAHACDELTDKQRERILNA